MINCRAENIQIKSKSDIKKKIELFKKLYGVNDVSVEFTGYYIHRGNLEYSYNNELSTDLKAISFYGKMIDFKFAPINEIKVCTISIYSFSE
jgi:hypothetical protein